MECIDINAWNTKIEKAFADAKLSLPEYETELKTILSVLSSCLTSEERKELEQRKEELTSLISDLENDTSFGFYSLDVQSFLETYNSTKPIKISFVKKDKESISKNRELSRDFLKLVNKYNKLLNMDLPEMKPIKKSTCVCGNNKDFEIVSEHIYYCLKCGVQMKEKIGMKSTFKDIDRVNLSNKYKYKRIIHMHDCIRQFQGKQQIRIPNELIRDVTDQIKLNGLELDDLNPQHIRSALQSTGWTKFYEHFILIWSMITKKPCPDISHLEEAIKSDFELFEREYNIYLLELEEENRSSFLSYPGCLYQLLNKQGYRAPLTFFNILKSENCIEWLDKVIGQIFIRLEWPGFIPLG